VLSRKILRPAAASAIIVGILLWFAHDGLGVYFTGDDSMNLYHYWTKPWKDILIANLAWYSPFYRPLGGLFYRGLFAAFGFNPLPFRVACFAIMLLNLGLFYWIGRQLAGSVEAGFLTALAGCYHWGFSDLYYNTGTVYDLLCFTFYVLTLCLYVRVRQQGRWLRWYEIVLIAALYICALNSKEMAVTLPLSMALYELVYHWHERSARQWLVAGLLAAMTLPYLHGKLSAASAFFGNSEYQPHISLKTYFDHYQRYLDYMFYRRYGWFTRRGAILLWAGMFLVAGITRRKALWFSSVFVLFSVLPVIFITQRGTLFVLYIPYIGYCLFLAATLAGLVGRTPRPAGEPPATHPALASVLFVLTAVLLVAAHQKPGRDIDSENQMRNFTEQCHAVLPRIPANSRILLFDDSFPLDAWAPLFLVRLSYHDATIQLDRTKTPDHPLDGYNFVLRFQNGKLIRLPG